MTAASFARAFERARSPELVSPADTYLREVRSWRASGLTLTVKLRGPAPDFAERLALPYFCAVPTWAPNEQRDNLPSAGPFAVSSYHRGRSLLLSGIRTTRGPRKTHVDAIEYRFGAFPSEIRLQLEDGEADYGVVTPAAFAELAAKKRDHTHLLVVQQPIVAYLALNTQRPLFHDNPQLRRAISYALDRPVLADMFGRTARSRTTSTSRRDSRATSSNTSIRSASPTSRRRGGSRGSSARGPRDIPRLRVAGVCRPRAGRLAGARQDRPQGRVKTSPGGSQLTLAAVRGTKFDITDVITRPDYGDPYALIDKLLDSRAIRSVGNTNLAYFASPT